jgi:hypothetical protein
VKPPLKRKRGRPRALPEECLVDLVNLAHYCDSPHRDRSLPAACRYIIANGGVRWIDKKTGETVAEIINARTLRTRLIEAENWYLGVKETLSTVNHPRAAEFDLPIKFGLTVERRSRPLPTSITRILGRRRSKRTMVTLGPPPKRTTRLFIGKKAVHSLA